MLIQDNIKTVYPSYQKSLCVFQPLDECHCWWTMTKYYGQLWSIRKVLGASNLSIKIVLKFCWFITPSVTASICFGIILASHINILQCVVCQRITKKGPIPETSVKSILLIQTIVKLCIYLREKSLFVLAILHELSSLHMYTVHTKFSTTYPY